MPDRRDSVFIEFQFSHCGVHVSQTGRIECKKYDALRVGLIGSRSSSNDCDGYRRRFSYGLMENKAAY